AFLTAVCLLAKLPESQDQKGTKEELAFEMAAAASKSALIPIEFTDPSTIETKKNMKIKVPDVDGATLRGLVEIIAAKVPDFEINNKLTYVDTSDGKTYEITDDDLNAVLENKWRIVVSLSKVNSGLRNLFED
ncbi:hypothetical protein HK405_007959, partial [Cladochytrium tenue]